MFPQPARLCLVLAGPDGVALPAVSFREISVDGEAVRADREGLLERGQRLGRLAVVQVALAEQAPVFRETTQGNQLLQSSDGRREVAGSCLVVAKDDQGNG